MSKNTIKIDGKLLRHYLENQSGLSIYEAAKSRGFSKNLIAQAIRSGVASPIVQMVAESYGVYKEDYILKEPEIGEADTGRQISIDDITLNISREELKDLIKETILETLDTFSSKEIRGYYDPIERVYTLAFKIK